MNKRFLITLMALIGIVLLQGCDNQKQNVKSTDKTKEDYFVYPISDSVSNFTVDENGMVYYAITSTVETEYTTTTGENIIIQKWEAILHVVDFYGNPVKSVKVPFSLKNKFCILRNMLYYYETVKDMENKLKTTFKVYDLEKEEEKTLIVVDDVENIKNFEVTETGIYFLGEDINLINKPYSLADSMDRFFYEGEIVVYVDFSTLQVKRLNIEFPVSFSKATDGQVVVYAYDEEKGYYFTRYDKESDQVSKPMYKNLKNLMGFVCSKDNDVILYTSPALLGGTITATSISKNEMVELLPDVTMDSNNFYRVGDYLYYKHYKNNNQIERIRYEDYMMGNKTIHMVSAVMEAFLPFGSGYKLEREFLSPEAFSLSVLSNDSNFDLSILSSWDEISDNIRRKGSFYPLNQVEGVEEYLDALFPYIKETATTPEGDVWMIPISIEIPFFVYDEEVCKMNGIDFSKDMNVWEFATMIRSIQNNTTLRNKVSYSDYMLVNDMFEQYTREYADFDEETFISLANEIKETFNYMGKSKALNNFDLRNELYNKNQKEHLFALDTNRYLYIAKDSSKIIPSLRASKLPSVGNNKKSVATSTFLTVNPNSKNLEATLEYITTLCNYLLQSENTWLFRKDVILENPLDKEIHRIYENAEIVFTLPYELYIYNFRHYLLGNMELSEMIKESNRKLDIYLKE